MAPGQVHQEQLETHREAEQVYAEAGADGPGDGQPGERGFVTKAAVGFVGYKVLKHILSNKNSNQPPQGQYGGQYGGGQQSGGGGINWGTALAGGAAGAGGALLLGKLFGVSTDRPRCEWDEHGENGLRRAGLIRPLVSGKGPRRPVTLTPLLHLSGRGAEQS